MRFGYEKYKLTLVSVSCCECHVESQQDGPISVILMFVLSCRNATHENVTLCELGMELPSASSSSSSSSQSRQGERFLRTRSAWRGISQTVTLTSSAHLPYVSTVCATGCVCQFGTRLLSDFSNQCGKIPTQLFLLCGLGASWQSASRLMLFFLR